jgi:hypothetical protein
MGSQFCEGKLEKFFDKILKDENNLVLDEHMVKIICYSYIENNLSWNNGCRGTPMFPLEVFRLKRS